MAELIEAFYSSIRLGTAPPLSPLSIRDTVRVCEQIGEKLRAAKVEYETRAEIDLGIRQQALCPVVSSRGTVLVTGGAGFLGRAVVKELRAHGWGVRSLSRRVPPPSEREPGIEYAAGDLSGALEDKIFQGISAIVHCAAETAGGQEAHERNSIVATKNLLHRASAHGIRRFVHVSSIAVLKTSKEMGRALDESTPVDFGNLSRGPYVWGKAEAEREVTQSAQRLGVQVRIIRPGPLVDFANFEPPGRLGRDLGPLFVAIGPRRGALSVCDVQTAAEVIHATIADMEAAPPVLNLVEPQAPTREELLAKFLARRPDLKAVWFPAWLLSILSPCLILAQRLFLGSKQPIDIAAAFASERYNTALAAQVVERAKA